MRRKARSCYIGGHWQPEGLRRQTRDWGARPRFEEAEEAQEGRRLERSKIFTWFIDMSVSP